MASFIVEKFQWRQGGASRSGRRVSIRFIVRSAKIFAQNARPFVLTPDGSCR
jgi:hypothetical protein